MNYTLMRLSDDALDPIFISGKGENIPLYSNYLDDAFPFSDFKEAAHFCNEYGIEITDYQFKLLPF